MQNFTMAETQVLRTIIEEALAKVRNDLEKNKEKLRSEICRNLLQRLSKDAKFGGQSVDILKAFNKLQATLPVDTIRDKIVEYCQSITDKSGRVVRDHNGEEDFGESFFEYRSYIAAPAVLRPSPRGNRLTTPTNSRQTPPSRQRASPSGTQSSNGTTASSTLGDQEDFEKLFSKIIFRLKEDDVLGPDMIVELSDPLLAKGLANTYSAHTDRSHTSCLFSKWLCHMNRNNSKDGHELCETLLLVLQHWHQHAPSKVRLPLSVVKDFIDTYTEDSRRSDEDPEFEVKVSMATGEVCTFDEYYRKQISDGNKPPGVSADRSTSDQAPEANDPTGSDRDADGDTDDDLYSDDRDPSTPVPQSANNGPSTPVLQSANNGPSTPVPQSANNGLSTTRSISPPETSAGYIAQSSSANTVGITANQPIASDPSIFASAVYDSSTPSKTTASVVSIPGLTTLDGNSPPAQAPNISTAAAAATPPTASTSTGKVSTPEATTATSLPGLTQIREPPYTQANNASTVTVFPTMQTTASSLAGKVSTAGANTATSAQDPTVLSSLPTQVAIHSTAVVSNWSAAPIPTVGNHSITGFSYGDVDMADLAASVAQPTEDGDVDVKVLEGSGPQATTRYSNDDVVMADPMAPASPVNDGRAPSIQSAGISQTANIQMKISI
jgi:hypothetical protein